MFEGTSVKITRADNGYICHHNDRQYIDNNALNVLANVCKALDIKAEISEVGVADIIQENHRKLGEQDKALIENFSAIQGLNKQMAQVIAEKSHSDTELNNRIRELQAQLLVANERLRVKAKRRR